MLITIVILAVLLAITFAAGFFFGTQLLKKFQIINRFILANKILVTNYWHPGIEKMGTDPGMRNIVIRSPNKKPFTVMVGCVVRIPKIVAWLFRLDVVGADPFGYVQSNDEGVAVISTYCGYSQVLFWFLGSSELVATSTDEDQELDATVVFPPHLYQLFGFYA